MLKFLASSFRAAALVLDRIGVPRGLPPGALTVHPTARFVWRNLRFNSQGSVSVDEDSVVGGHMVIEKTGGQIRIGKRVFMNGSLQVAERIEIGDDVLIAWGVTIVDNNSHSIGFSLRARDVLDYRSGSKDWTPVKIAPVYIKSKAWIGFNAIILKGVTVGEGAVVGSGSVVTRSVPDWTIVAGNPARVIREIPAAER